MVENFCIHTETNPYEFLKKWTIHLFSLDETNPAFFGHITLKNGQRINTGITSGVTGMYEIKLWLHDDDDEFKNRENAVTTCHELAHAVLFHKHGSFGNIHVTRVHDNTKRFKIKFWYKTKYFYKRFTASCVDIRPFV